MSGQYLCLPPAAAMIEGVLRHDTEMEVERQYVDSRGQSEVEAFGPGPTVEGGRLELRFRRWLRSWRPVPGSVFRQARAFDQFRHVLQGGTRRSLDHCCASLRPPGMCR
jgi:hypothetical protein